MTTLFTRVPLLGVALFLIVPVAAADPPTDPLPKGAKLRLGTQRMRDPAAWTGAALTPDGKFLIANTPKGLMKFDVTTGDPVCVRSAAVVTNGGPSRSDSPSSAPASAASSWRYSRSTARLCAAAPWPRS